MYPRPSAASDTIKVQLASGPITVRFGYIDAPEHDRTQVDPAKGERWFCSKREALAAGWRAQRN